MDDASGLAAEPDGLNDCFQNLATSASVKGCPTPALRRAHGATLQPAGRCWTGLQGGNRGTQRRRSRRRGAMAIWASVHAMNLESELKDGPVVLASAN